MNLIVFDIDDTVTKSEYQHQLAYVNAMKEMGITKINQDWKTYKHHTDSYILKRNYENNFDREFDLKSIPSFESKMTKIMNSLKIVEEIPGAKEFIDYLRLERNYALAFATGSLRKPALLKLQQAGLWHDEKLVATANEYYEREQIVTSAIEKANEYYKAKSFEHIISIGDGLWDLKTARNLNLKFIGVGMKNIEDFKKEKIEVHTENWKDFDFESAEEKLEMNNYS